MRTFAWAAAVAATAVLAGCGSGAPTGPDRLAGGGAWRATAPSPLSARHESLAVRVGEEVLVLGGRDDPMCPPNAGCAGPERDPRLRDGAAYDPSRDTWRTLEPAPVPLGLGEHAVIGDTVYALVHRYGAVDSTQALAYDVGDDAWRVLPPLPPGYWRLVATDRQVVAYASTHEDPQHPRGDVVLDEAAARWRRLPDDPLEPSFDRFMVWAGDRLVLLAPKLVPQPGGADGPSWVRAATYDPSAGAWTRLPETEQVTSGYLFPVWDGTRVLNPAPEYVDGGRVNSYGRRIPVGGWMDVTTGEWEPLPEPDHAWHRGWGVTAVSPTYSATGSIVFDAPRRRWIALSPPPDAPEQGQAAAWVGDALVVWGGGRFGDRGSVLSASGAVWTPPAA